jgi:hypothetical protein
MRLSPLAVWLVVGIGTVNFVNLDLMTCYVSNVQRMLLGVSRVGSLESFTYLAFFLGRRVGEARCIEHEIKEIVHIIRPTLRDIVFFSDPADDFQG